MRLRRRRRLAGALAMLSILASSALAQSEAELTERFCRGMSHTEYSLPDGTRVDCLSDTHAIEVEFTENWAEAVGQSLHYALWTREIAANPEYFEPWSRDVKAPLQAGVIFICHRRRDTCTDHTVRFFRLVEEFRLPITVWDCEVTDVSLSACLEFPAPE